MANSSDSSRSCDQNGMNSKTKMSAHPLNSYIDVNQRILLPRDYNASSQLLQLKIRIPTVTLVNDNNTEGLEKTEKSSEVDDNIESTRVIEYQSIEPKNVGRIVPKTSHKTQLKEAPIKNAEIQTTHSILESDMNSTASFFSFDKSFNSSLSSDSRRINYKKYISEITTQPALNTSFHAYQVSMQNKFPNDCIDSKSTKKTSPKMVRRRGFVKETIKFFESQSQEANKLRRRYTAPSNSKLTKEQVNQFFESKDYNKIEFQKKPQLKTNRPKSAYGSVRKYLKRLDSKNGKEDSQIIKELVLARYRNALQHFIEKSERRRRISCDEHSSEKSVEWRDSGNNSIDDVHEEEDGFEACNCSASTSRADTLDGTFIIKKIEDKSVVYDEREFLDMALGSDLGDSSNTLDSNTTAPSCSSKNDDNSVGTSHLSQLISGAYDLYSIVDQSKRKNRQSIITYESINESMESMEGSRDSMEKSIVPMTESTALMSDESTTNNEPVKAQYFEKNKEIVEHLMIELNKESTTIFQVSKALDLCGKMKDFYETCERIEAERVLLVATLRKEVIIEEMAKVDYEDVHDQKNGNVRLSNIKIPLIWTLENNAKYTRFFVCIFRCGPTLLSSALLTPNEETDLEINKCLYFDDLPADFEITVYIYSMYAKINDKTKNSSMKSIKDCARLFHSLKNVFSPKKKVTNFQTDKCSLKRPSFILYGKGSITRTCLQQKEIKIHNVFPRLPLANSMKYDIDTLVKLTNKMAGFLTIGEVSNEIMTWNRQWCVMEAEEMKFWDYPGRENEIAPNQVINISRCLQQSIPAANKTLCSRPRSLYLELGPVDDDQEFYSEDRFLSLDNSEEFLRWKDELNCVLNTLIQWNCMKKYFYKR